MAVMVATSLGDMVVDLYTDQCPVTTKNFLKLCKIKYYNHCLFHSVQKDFIVQTGDPSGIGSGGESIYSFLYGEQARFFDDEIKPKLKHDKIGVLAMASAGENLNASQFYITTRAGIDYLDGKHTVFGEVAEGLETLMRINEAFVDEKNRPYKNIRIKHMYILDDPFDDPPGLAELIPDMSPELKPPGPGQDVRLEDDWVPLDEQLDPAELEQSLRKKEAHSRAVVLEMIGDIPEAEMKPPENVLFVCKLNPVTQDEDLEIIFSRFGKVISADIIRDYKTGDSLCYGFIEFESQEACEAAYFKMDNTLIDDRRIHVDFSQSVARLWTRFRRFGIKDSSEAANPSSKGCFKCGEPGHFAKDCTNTGKGGETEGPPETKRYELKEDGQRGNLGKRYEMLFPDEGPKREYHGRDAGKSQERGEDAPSPASRMEKKHERHHDGMQRESPRDAHDRDHGRGRHRDHERVHHRDGPRPPRHREDFQKGRGSDDRRERYYGDRKRRETEDEEPREGGHRGDVDRRHRRSDRERERREEARRDQEDREKEAAESESRDRKRRERDTGSREEDKHRQDRHYKDVDRSRRPHEQRRDRN